MTAVPMFFTSMKMFTVFSSAWTLRLGCIVLLTGCWFRQLSTYDGNKFWPIVAGSFVISLANPIFLCAQNLICNKWFGDKERGLATALSGLSIPLGSVVGFIQTGLVFQGI